MAVEQEVRGEGAGVRQEQLEMLEKSLWYILMTLGAVVFSFWSVVLQRRLLAGELAGREAEAERQIFWLRGASASIILWVSNYFYNITKNAARQTPDGDEAPLGTAISLLILVASALRVVDLLQGGAQTPESTGVQEEPL